MPEQLAKAQSHLDAIANAFPDPIFIMGEDGTYLDVIGGRERALYADGRSLVGRKYHDVLPKEMADRFLKVVQITLKTGRLQEIEYALSNDEIDGIEQNGPQGTQWYEARVYPVDTDAYGQPAVLWLAINITRRKHMEEQLEALSKYDPLTGLLNRDFFLGVLDEELKRTRLNNEPLSLIKIDLECFRNVVDTFGHEAGDRAILHATHALKKVIEEPGLGFLGRLSCDQFMAALPGMKAVDAFRVAKLAQQAISSQQLEFNGIRTCLTTRGGVTEVRDESDNAETLFKRVNQAIAELANSRENTKIA
ncbi:diguanylate cyclase (GGDEF) domain-containing protein [Sulfurivirga caldicuralii]|uniref:Diguanylate cyclase (GGDEF) domain-containing protein n=1 Tax=Sulfurivirga caldicuralii TaxID=364032 RepID=A0A1N6E255_9GAMM|nr:sensor domain-containing diguanylate cyclase [Sulfurivirga caldicuralii]SIN77053.1 diguanylate cyclase (GGDEF) domain-containing protein [Sulfurivirga caldicuralii]